jgi:hypothetical protein
MHLIWYNGFTGKYEYGSSRDLKILKDDVGTEALTILMEFTEENTIAKKIITDLNNANKNLLMVV